MGVCGSCCDRKDKEVDLIMHEFKFNKKNPNMPKITLTPSTDLSNLSPESNPNKSKSNYFSNKMESKGQSMIEEDEMEFSELEDCQVKSNQKKKELKEDLWLQAEDIHIEQQLYNQLINIQTKKGVDYNSQQNSALQKIEEIDDEQIIDKDFQIGPNNMFLKSQTIQQNDHQSSNSLANFNDEKYSQFSFETDVKLMTNQDAMSLSNFQNENRFQFNKNKKSNYAYSKQSSDRSQNSKIIGKKHTYNFFQNLQSQYSCQTTIKKMSSMGSCGNMDDNSDESSFLQIKKLEDSSRNSIIEEENDQHEQENNFKSQETDMQNDQENEDINIQNYQEIKRYQMEKQSMNCSQNTFDMNLGSKTVTQDIVSDRSNANLLYQNMQEVEQEQLRGGNRQHPGKKRRD